MEQSDTDWGEWSLNNAEEESAEVEDVKDEIGTLLENKTPQPDTSKNMTEDLSTDVGFYDDYEPAVETLSMSENSDDDDDDDDEFNVPGGSQAYFYKNKEGLAQCEYCGKFGVRDAFYSKTKQFCSVACSRNYSNAVRDGRPIPKFDGPPKMKAKKPKKKVRQSKETQGETFNWNRYLDYTMAQAAPVSSFRHCPMSEAWVNIAVGMKVEVPNTDCDLPITVYWIATVIKLAGYKANLRYEGFGSNPQNDFWLNLCSKQVHPVGWCAANMKSLVPPNTIQDKSTNWKEFLVRRLTGARTLPHNFYKNVQEGFSSSPIKVGMRVEVVDKMCVSAMRVATVKETTGGRLMLRYENSPYENELFWCHAQSNLLHPIGWSQTVGHEIKAPDEYKAESLEKARSNIYSVVDTPPEMLPQPRYSCEEGDDKFQVGYKLEAVDPLNLSSVCVASVMKVLDDNYLMVGIDGSMAENGTDWFCYHASSPCIFPVGFSSLNNIDLTPPRNYKNQKFVWLDYLKKTKTVAAPVKLFEKELPNHGFEVEQKIEAVDLMDPRLICVATIRRVVGRLLRIHFDGWEDTYDQWIDCASPDLYPVGYCDAVGYKLEGPMHSGEGIPPYQMPLPSKNKRKSKSQIYRGPRKKRKSKPTPPKRYVSQTSLDLSEASQDSFTSETATDKIKSSIESRGGQKLILQLSKDRKTISSIGEASCMPILSPSSQAMVPRTFQSMPVLTESAKSTNLSSALPSITSILNAPSRTLKGTATIVYTSSSLTAGQTINPSHSSMAMQPSQHGSPLAGSTISLHPGLPVHSNTADFTQLVSHHIPKDLLGEKGKRLWSSDELVTPEKWTVNEVCQFLKQNDCAAHCENFRKKDVDGAKFMTLTKEQIVNLIGMKVGPSLKIADLIKALKDRVSQQTKGLSSILYNVAKAGGDSAKVVLKSGPNVLSNKLSVQSH